MPFRTAAFAAVAVLALAGSAHAFTLTSPSFKDLATLPLKYAGNQAGNTNCVGTNVSPALSWSAPPAGTKSFALEMVDLEGRNGTGVNHFVAYGIPVGVTGFKEGELSAPSPNYVGGKSTQGLATFMGPCPPAGTGAHHYSFVLIATDLDPKALPPGLTREEMMAKVSADNHALGASGITGLFAHP
jgi:hypothetical protein